MQPGSGRREKLYEWINKRTFLQKVRNTFRNWIYYSIGVGVLSLLVFYFYGSIANVFNFTPTEMDYIYIGIAGVASAALGVTGGILWIVLETITRILEFLTWSFRAVFS